MSNQMQNEKRLVVKKVEGTENYRIESLTSAEFREQPPKMRPYNKIDDPYAALQALGYYGLKAAQPFVGWGQRPASYDAAA